ncbi:hypothetical protein ACF09H_39615 [Streptomyces sp. NPDC014983]|uniref:hypothetical protein n=1 Tax=Streptomyces sp. NPDC014983 TaxID=3364933 RepID=UPI0036F844B2
MPVAAGGVPPNPYETTVVRVTFHRPFASLAVDRESRLVLAGLVTESAPYQDTGLMGAVPPAA